jgi:glycerol kinase
MILAIDQSTSATKAVLVDELGHVVDKASRGHRQIYPVPGWVEHDAEEIWQNLLWVVREVGRRHDLSKLLGVSITNQRETVLIFDASSGRPLAHAVVWLCRRGDALCQRLRDSGHDERVRARTGLRIDTYFSGSKLAWLVESRPDLLAKLRGGTARIGTVDAYLVHRLTRGAVFATDHSNASRTLLFDVARLAWDPELCDLFSVPQSALPEVRDSFARFGETDIEGMLPRRVPLVGVMGDSQASLFA